MHKILFLVPHPVDDASCRYRVQQFVPYLERAGYMCSVRSFSSTRLFAALKSKGRLATKAVYSLPCAVRRFFDVLKTIEVDLVVIHREAFPFLVPIFERLVLSCNPRVVFSFDDAIYVGHGDTSSLNHPWLYQLKYGSGVDEILRRCIHVIAGNRILAEYALQLNPNVSIVPTVVDCGDYRYKPPDLNGGRFLTIGWMGSRSTISYLQAIEPALRRLANANPGKIRFCFYGYPECEIHLPGLVSLPFRLESEIEDLRSLDIGLMPMPDTEWTRGKCAFKAIQYMAAGIPTVASPVGITTDLIKSGVNGLLARSAEDWFACLTLLVRDAELRKRLSLNARATIERGYSLELWAPRFVSLFDGLAASFPANASSSSLVREIECREPEQ
jgi:glycosyltransferase involved in cell wall biosynthesis